MMCDVGFNDAQPMLSYDNDETAAGGRFVGVEGEVSSPSPDWGQERSV